MSDTTELLAESRRALDGAVGFIYLRGLAIRLTEALEVERGHMKSLAKWVGEDDETDSLGIACEVSTALEAASPRVVTSVAELDALLNGSIVRADYDNTTTAERRWDRWYVTAWGDDNGVTSQYLHDWVELAPFTVLWVGGTE